MRSSIEMRRLLGLGEARLHSNQGRVSGSRERLGAMDAQLAILGQQTQALREVLHASQLHNTTVSHEALLGGLRRQAVIRRQLHEATLEHGQLRATRADVEQQLQRHLAERVRLQGRQQKYRCVASLSASRARQHRLQLEEHEIEDQWVSKR